MANSQADRIPEQVLGAEPPSDIVTRLPETAVAAHRIREFVLQAERVRQADLSFRTDAALAPLPECAAGLGLSHYLLLAAAIDVGVNSNDIRPFLRTLDDYLRKSGRGLFDLTSADSRLVRQAIADEMSAGRLRGWQAKRHVHRILDEANTFVREHAGGHLDVWVRDLSRPAEAVGHLARGIFFQGAGSNETRKKMWMLMRWLVRPAPDLRLWSHLSPAGLMVPVDRHVARFAAAAGIITGIPKAGPTWTEVVTITDFAQKLFPHDPACVDYAFFMWGRGRSRGSSDPDTCHFLFKAKRLACPLAGIMPCSSHCGLR